MTTMKAPPATSKYVVTHRTRINAPASKVWEVISMPGNLNYCHPFCEENKVTTWGKTGAQDSIKYFNGLTLHRSFTDWQEGKGYELIIGTRRHAAARVFWEVHPIDETNTELSIDIHLFPKIALSRYPKLLRGAIRRFYFVPNMAKYVKAVVDGFKYYIETGKSVEKNQFGHNKMFSTATH